MLMRSWDGYPEGKWNPIWPGNASVLFFLDKSDAKLPIAEEWRAWLAWTIPEQRTLNRSAGDSQLLLRLRYHVPHRICVHTAGISLEIL